MADRGRALQVADRITRRLSRPIPFEGQPCRIGVSGGLVLSPPRAFPQAEALLRQADAALYAAKRAGRGQTVARDWLP
jgi:GGDEF domain-containing protein